MGWGRAFRDARDGQYEALLKGTHPRRYRSHLTWIDGRAVPAYYWAQYLAPLALPAGAPAAAALLAMGTAATLAAWCRGREVRILELAARLPQAMLVPYWRLAWVAWGWWRYPRAPETGA